MSAGLTERVRAAVAAHVSSLGSDPTVEVSLEVPPKPEFGDLACPVAFELARRLKRPPREIASGIQSALAGVPGVARVEVAGGGYLNVFFDRDLFLRALAAEVGRDAPPSGAGKRIVEHTNINPNKAAHIGHLRNAVLGDTLARCLRFLGEAVEVQNYIDDTGVQVADLAVGFLDIRGVGLEDVTLIAGLCAENALRPGTTRRFVSGDGEGRLETLEDRAVPEHYPFDHYCWDLYAEVAPFYASSPARAARRGLALQQMEEGHGPYAEIASFVSSRMVLHHLRTMRWIDVHYDLLPRESDILALGFWQAAFALLKQSGAIRLAAEGKAQGCWVMDLPEAAEAEDEGAKIIVRSNGTVTYVGKDIAYQMWKFGLLGRDFSYERVDTLTLPPSLTDALFARVGAPPRALFRTCSGGGVSEPGGRSASQQNAAAPRMGGGEPAQIPSAAAAARPRFGGAARVYNVIDVRQSYLQKVVSQGLRALGHEREARESIHFSYEMVALTPRSVERLSRLGLIPHVSLGAEDLSRPYVEMSGRRGIGVKAEDLLTALANSAAEEVARRRPEIPGAERAAISAQIAVGALRYYMLRYTRNRVVAFDVEDSLAFEGETGPYLQYAAVRSRNIFHKLAEREGFDRSQASMAIESSRFETLDPADAVEHWQIAREIARLPEIVEQAVSSLELSVLARYVFSVSQRFSTFYHRYPILHEPDPSRRALRIALNEIYLRFMEASLSLMGVPLPDRM